MKFSVQNLINLGKIDSTYTIFGWIRSKRGNKQITFLAVNDGSCFENIQVVSELEKDLTKLLNFNINKEILDGVDPIRIKNKIMKCFKILKH